MDYGNCIICHTELSSIDDDPNGEHNSKCKRCESEEDHDFDADPTAVFDRFGNYVEDAT